MITRELLTPRLVVDSLRSNVCPACGGRKGRAKTMCLTDYRKLPIAMRKALYAHLGEGYEQAVFEALRFLNVETFHQ